MTSIRSAIERTVPITSFNRGLAGKIFADVKRTGPKVVMRNNVAECVLMSPEEYIRLMDELEEAKLAAAAADRWERADSSKAVPIEALDERFGFTEDDLADADEVEFE